MDGALPSYDEATTVNAWSLIAPYVTSQDLCSCVLVCKQWHALFVPQLWSHPGAHFNLENDSIYLALTRFKRTLKWAPLSLRRMTVALHLPPGHKEAYEAPHAEWLRDILEMLPRLQSLVVRELSFLDHATLLTLRYPSRLSKSPQEMQITYGLRLLDASHCENATYLGLEEALKHLPLLMYLDLSYTSAAAHPSVLQALRLLRELRVLRLRAVELDDSAVGLLTSSTGMHVSSLDLRDNCFGDQLITELMAKCFHLPLFPNGSPARATEFRRLENGPVSSTNDYTQHRQGHVMMDVRLRRALIRGQDPHRVLSDFPASGLSELFLSGNQITAGGAASILESSRLTVLDLGDLVGKTESASPAGQSSNLLRSRTTTTDAKAQATLNRFPRQSLRYLRIDHSLFTRGCSPVVTNNFSASKRDDKKADIRVPIPSQSHIETSNMSDMLSLDGAPDPGRVPHLQTLILTNIPSTTADPSIGPSLTHYISRCARAASIARDQAHSASVYARPPGWSRPRYEKYRTSELFPLKRIVLEVSPPSSDSPARRLRRSRGSGSGSAYINPTEDRDSEAMWHAARNDFSFFEGEAVVPRQQPSPRRSTGFSTPMYDPIAHVAAFRRARRNAQEKAEAAAAMQAGSAVQSTEASNGADPEASDAPLTPMVEGFWPGEVQVVRISRQEE